VHIRVGQAQREADEILREAHREAKEILAKAKRQA
jgi:vacuolar-type H+-ATPase subunit H